MYESTIPPVSEDADGRALVADHEFLFHVMNASLEAQDVLKAMGLELRPRSISRLPLEQVFDELFLIECKEEKQQRSSSHIVQGGTSDIVSIKMELFLGRCRERPAPNRRKHHWLRVVVRHSHLRY